MASHFSGPLFGPGRVGAILGSRGRTFYVDPANGSDSHTPRGNPEGSNTPSDTALAKLSVAHDTWADTRRGDTIILISNGDVGSTARESATLTWSKDAVHLIGDGAPTRIAQRSRISSTAGATAFSPLMNITGNGNVFSNLHVFHGFDDASTQVAVQVTGQRNYFENCHFAGMGHATAGDQAGGRSLLLAGGDENTFVNCVIGLDTIARSTTNSEIGFTGAATRNYFQNCDIITFADNAGHFFVDANASGAIDRFAIFDNCRFINAVGSTATTMTGALSVHASAGGLLVLNNCMLIGATDWTAADNANVYLHGPGMGTSGNLNTGLAHTTDVS